VTIEVTDKGWTWVQLDGLIRHMENAGWHHLAVGTLEFHLYEFACRQMDYLAEES